MNYEQFTHGDKRIFLVDMTKELDHNFSELMKRGLAKYLQGPSSKGKKIGIIVNKKGFSNGVICYDCGHIPQCKRCSVPISFHKTPAGTLMGMCHICKMQYLYPEICEECGTSKIAPYGMGTQQVAEWIEQEYHVKPLIIESETVNSPGKVKRMLEQIQGNDSHILIGTALLAQPIRDYTFDLLIFLNADLGLNIPDYNVNERNFQLLYEAFTKHSCNNFVVQSMKVDQFSLRFACKLDKEGFYEQEYAFRKQFLYPPFGELCVILYKDEIESKMFKKVDSLYQELLYLQQKYDMQEMEIYATPPMIYKMFGKYRYNIILKGKEVRNFMDIVYTKLNFYKKGFKIDRMAESIV